jgi:serine/threonine protein kinase
LLHQLLDAVRFLHQEKFIIHRDIKLSNLLYNNRGQLKLADFGLARTFYQDANLTQNVVTLWYRAPELLLGATTYTCSIDCWAIGCTLGELLLQRPILPGDNEMDQLFRIFGLVGCPNTRIWPEVEDLPLIRQGKIDLRVEREKYPYNNIKVLLPALGEEGFLMLNQLLAYDPKKRLSCEECLQHDYFYSPPYPKEFELMPTFPTFHTDVGKYL